MGYNLPLPDGYFFPSVVNGWEYDPEARYNGDAWFSPDRTQSVVGFNCMGKVRAQIHDERCRGFANHEPVVERREVLKIQAEEAQERTEARLQANADLLEDMVAWMRENPPGEWSHSLVNEAVFDAPAGFELGSYSVEKKKDVIQYKRKEPAEDYRAECLVVSGYRVSGSYEACHTSFTEDAVAYSNDYHEIEVPEECGLDVALTVVRSYARDLADCSTGDELSAGQTDLGAWSA